MTTQGESGGSGNRMSTTYKWMVANLMVAIFCAGVMLGSWLQYTHPEGGWCHSFLSWCKAGDK